MCLRCRKHTPDIESVEKVHHKRRFKSSKCPQCGAGKSRILGKDLNGGVAQKNTDHKISSINLFHLIEHLSKILDPYVQESKQLAHKLLEIAEQTHYSLPKYSIQVLRYLKENGADDEDMELFQKCIEIFNDILDPNKQNLGEHE